MTTIDLETKLSKARAQAEQIETQIADREQRRSEATRQARLDAANRWVNETLPALSDELKAAEDRLHEIAYADHLSLSALFDAYAEVADLATLRHFGHNAANGVLDSLDRLPQNKICADVSRPTVADTWRDTPWDTFITRVFEQRRHRQITQAGVSHHALEDAAVSDALSGLEG